MKKISTLFARYLVSLVSRIGINRIFRLANGENLLTRSFVHSENLLTRSLVPMERAFLDWAKMNFQASKMKKISTFVARNNKTLVSQICRNRIFRLFTLETTRQKYILRPKYEGNFHLLRGTLKRCVHESAKIAYSDCQNAKNFSHETWYMLINCKQEAWYPWNVDFSPRQNKENEENENFHTLCEIPWNVDFSNRQKTHFQAAKKPKICSHEAWFLREKCPHVDFTTGQNRIFRPQKVRELPHLSRGTMKRWFHESAKIV